MNHLRRISIVLLALTALFYSPLNAQESDNESNISLDQLFDRTRSNLLPTTDNRYVEGSPYLVDDWRRATIELTGGHRTKFIPTKFNIYESRLEVKHEDRIMAFGLEKVNQFDFVAQNGKRVTFKNNFNSEEYDIHRAIPLQVLHEGPVMLLKKYKVNLVEAFGNEYGSGHEVDEYVRKEFYYLRMPNEKFHEVKTRKWSFFRNLPSHKQEIKKYVKDRDLDLDKEEDLIKIADYYSSLLEKESS